jgi:hypothetical protein
METTPLKVTVVLVWGGRIARPTVATFVPKTFIALVAGTRP